MALKAIVFDLDGTLVDSRKDLVKAVNHALRETGRPERSSSEIVGFVGNGVRALVSGAMGPVSGERLEAGLAAFSAFYAAHALDETRLYEGVAQTLAELSGRFRFAVVTNKGAAFSDQILTGLGVRNHFSALVGGDTLTEKKPHPAPVRKALELLGVAPADALMVGDGAQDLAAGRAAGLRTCLATYGFGEAAGGPEPDFRIKRFAEIKEIVT